MRGMRGMRGMGRFALFITCLAGMLALAALGAGVAAAEETPEWYECLKVKSGGAYEKDCAKEGGKGGYLATPGVGSASFEAQGKGTVTLKTDNSDTIVCAHFNVSGQKVMPNRLTGVTLTLSLCARSTNKKYHCAAQEEMGGPKEKALIESETLSGELGYISRSPLEVGLKLSSTSEPGKVVFPRIYCIGPPGHERWSGTFVGQLGGAINISDKKATLTYQPGPYLGEVEPGYTPLVDPSLEGEEPGALWQEPQVGLGWGSPTIGALEGRAGITGTQMIKA